MLVSSHYCVLHILNHTVEESIIIAVSHYWWYATSRFVISDYSIKSPAS